MLYLLQTPVRTAIDGKTAPLRYAAAVEAGLRNRLGADRGYSGQFVRAWDNGKGVDPGRALASAQDDDLKSHKHNAMASMDGLHSHETRFIRDRAPTAPGNAVLGDENWYGEQSAWSQPAGLHTHSITVDNFGGTETRP